MSDLIEEIDEEIKRDKTYSLIVRYRYYIIGLVVLILTTTLAYVIAEHMATKRAENLGNIYYNAMKSKAKTDELDIIIEDKSGYSALAALKKASILITNNEINKAAELYNDIWSNRLYDKAFRDLAALHKLLIITNNSGKFPTNDVEQFISELGREENAYSHNLTELKAAWYIQQGNILKAEKLLSELVQDEGAPLSLRTRAKALKHYLLEDNNSK